ncbi:hypothetical protein HMPREF9554_00414 [Treponema phagedenis F0421]|nr:hypothetical protein HMPREF9554_00414 [Treponema phagedenis F0421]
MAVVPMQSFKTCGVVFDTNVKIKPLCRALFYKIFYDSPN